MRTTPRRFFEFFTTFPLIFLENYKLIGLTGIFFFFFINQIFKKLFHERERDVLIFNEHQTDGLKLISSKWFYPMFLIENKRDRVLFVETYVNGREINAYAEKPLRTSKEYAQFQAGCSVLRLVRFVPCRFAPLTKQRLGVRCDATFVFRSLISISHSLHDEQTLFNYPWI